MLNLELGAKQNFDVIDKILPGLTNYQAVKKALQRLKKRNLRGKIITTDFSVVVESTSNEEKTTIDESDRKHPAKIDYSLQKLTYDEYISIFYHTRCLPWWYTDMENRYAVTEIL